MLKYIWLIPLAPLAGFVVIGLLTMYGKLPAKVAGRVGVAASALSFLLALGAVIDFAGGVGKYEALAAAHPGVYEVAVGSAHEAARFEVTPLSWMPATDTMLKGWDEGGHRFARMAVDWTFAFDALTAIMLMVVTFVGTLIHVYSLGYMAGDPGFNRFFAYLNLFMAMMLTLVLGGNMVVMFVGWEGVGLCSYLLIGYFYDQVFDKESGLTCADAGRKAFITNRIGDFGFLLGLLLLVVTFGTVDFSEIAAAINGSSSYWYGAGLLAGVGILLFVGATGKSAQLPLYVWLPDAMAGPTPVSALIHAATMVTAGVYMLSRMSSLFWHAPVAMLVVAVVGCATAVFAGTMGTAQNDIKKVLAYSTVSQLGYMFLGAGVGAFVASIFHLVTHAFFKACLFLGAGSVIARSGHSNDMRWYGGLKKWMPLTAGTFLVATLAITGLPFLSGFMSKDEILAQALFSNRGSAWLWIFGVIGALFTSFYMFRCYWMTFLGENRAPREVREQLTESPRVMTYVLVTLAAGAVVVGFLGIPAGVTNLVHGPNLNWFEKVLHPVVAAQGVPAKVADAAHGAAAEHGAAAAEHGAAAAEHGAASGHAAVLTEGWRRHPSMPEEWGLFALAAAIFAAGLVAARWAYGEGMARATALAAKMPFLRRLLHRKWFVDEFYQVVVLGPFYRLSDFFAGFDRWVVDGAVNGTARTTLALSYVKATVDRWGVDLAVNGVGWGVRMGSFALRRTQTGFVQSYAAMVVVGAFALLAAYLLFVR